MEGKITAPATTAAADNRATLNESCQQKATSPQLTPFEAAGKESASGNVRNKVVQITSKAKRGRQVAIGSNLLPFKTLRKFALGETRVFPTQNGGDIEKELKSERVALIARALVKKQTRAQRVRLLLHPKHWRKLNKGRTTYHTSKHMTKN